MSNQNKWFLEVHPETLAILNATQSESETWPQVEVDKEIVTVITPNDTLEIATPSFDIIKADEDGLVIAGRAKKFLR